MEAPTRLARGVVGAVLGTFAGLTDIPIYVYFSDGPEYMFSFATFLGYSAFVMLLGAVGVAIATDEH